MDKARKGFFAGKARWAAVAISLFFVISIIASGFLYNIPTNEAPTQPQDELPDITPTQISMEADEVDARVVLMLPKLKLVAETEEANASDIDSAIYQISGVRRVESIFSQLEQPEISASLYYIADIYLTNEASPSEVVASIEAIPSLEDIEGFPFALVDLPQTIEFYNRDLNISKEYTLKRHESEAVVDFSTVEGDELTVSLAAIFLGNDVLTIMAYQLENKSSTPVFGETVVEAEVASLQPTLLLGITPPYSKLSILPELEQQIESIEGVADVNFSVPEIEPSISLYNDENVSEETAADLNSLLQSFGGELTFFNEGYLTASVSFEQATDLTAIIEAINEKLLELELGNAEVIESSGFASAEVTLESENSSASFPQISSLLESQGFEFSLVQPGEISLQEITAEETQQTYSVEDGLVESSFSQPRSIGETVQVTVNYFIIRDEIVSITASE